MSKPWFFLLFVLLLAACSNDDCSENVDYSAVDIDLAFEDLTHAIYGIESREELVSFFEENPVVRDYFFGFGDLIPKQNFLNEVLRFTQVPKVKAIFKAPDFERFQELLDQNRDVREYLTYEYLMANKQKSLEDIYELLKGSRLEDLTNTEAIDQYLESNPEEYEYFKFVFGFQTPEDLLNENFELLQNPYVDTLYQETLALISAQEVAYELDQAFGRLKGIYPDFSAPKVQAVYSAFGKDLFLSDSLIVIGLDYYLGEEASYRPNIYDYILNRMSPDHLVPQLMQFMSLRYNKTKQDSRTVLDEMIYYGKAMAFAKQMLPCVNDSLIIGYSRQQLADATVSEALIWSHFVEERLLYSEDPTAITRYIDERPSVLEIDKRCPGRIGQWLGWQIVNAYMKETGADFKELMAETDAQKILMQSKYRPRSR
ncbi:MULTISPECIES: hypothetical protein [Roseivirga]|jgi:hypothetical protein|uniref:Gliding motility lipoprotein GldB n=1 Tax=Roseivirga thermotolerans TaxID=1758176 RepID=A0ABQ3I5D9_9BACT|nr:MULTISPECIES: hypothetical protein [Roseivirga]GHE55870.1 hypothetical protein GCM10011340_08310 [Roseivirga thermotolerans]|tara:strand:- start:43920 stop:45203 length:1284 start_codon:yes stop_codon:yes gene_type:complete